MLGGGAAAGGSPGDPGAERQEAAAVDGLETLRTDGRPGLARGRSGETRAGETGGPLAAAQNGAPASTAPGAAQNGTQAAAAPPAAAPPAAAQNGPHGAAPPAAAQNGATAPTAPAAAQNEPQAAAPPAAAQHGPQAAAPPATAQNGPPAAAQPAAAQPTAAPPTAAQNGPHVAAPPAAAPPTGLARRLEEHRRRERALLWRGTFADYYDMVRRDPRIARLAHARIHDMIAARGTVTSERGETLHGFFARDLFGLQRTLDLLSDYFASAAKRLEVRKRILLLMGPVGGGKSTIVTLLKRGIEEYTQTGGGALYAIDGCPMHEEPLHLIPAGLRAEIQREDGVYIEGDLCPYCRWRLRDEWGGEIERVPVVRTVFSEKDRVGIGTFTPSDEKTQDVSELVGSVDLSTIGRYGSESDPRAYRFDGELNVANRGLVELVEILKCQEEFLYGLLTLSQEQSIKTARFSMLYADECIVSHTNEAEYNAFVSNPKNEALRDRIILIRVPYNLRVSDEMRIYEKLLSESGISDVHIAPHTLRVASCFAVLTRLHESRKAGMSLMKKLKLYDGETVEGFGQGDVRELQDEAEREGMEGISPRYVINRLSSAIARDGIACLGPLDALRALKDGLEQHTGLPKEARERYLNLIYEARREYDETAKTEVHKAFVYSFEESARTIFANYLDAIEAYMKHERLKDPITGDEVEPDEKLMRSVEEQIGVTENAKRAFREEILIRISSLARRGQSFDYRTHERLREALEKKLFADLRNIVKSTRAFRALAREFPPRQGKAVQYGRAFPWLLPRRRVAAAGLRFACDPDVILAAA